MKINESFVAQMREAAGLLQSEGPMAATEAIQRALGGASAASAPSADLRSFYAGMEGLDVLSRVDTPFARPGKARRRGLWKTQDVEDVEVHEGHQDHQRPGAAQDKPPRGRFIAGSCTNAAGTRAYKLYIPSAYRGEPLPLVVMLHGCTQNPDDFAIGTGMNDAAEEQGCFVVYPGQPRQANQSGCWNWFQPGDQERGQGEPSIIADIVRQVGREYKVDSARVHAAGLSAGGAMAVNLAASYPDLFAAIGVHSGLPYRCARDMPSAFAAMKAGRGKRSRPQGAMSGMPEMAMPGMGMPEPPAQLVQTVPTIVFHGEGDKTVHPANGDKLLRQCLGGAGVSSEEERGAVHGRSYVRTLHRDADGRVVGEQWLLRGAGHAWSGGNGKGTHTDPQGPSASREMLRFFREHALRNA